MSTTVLSIRSVDGNLELALCPATIELRLSPQAARNLDEACEAQKSAAWLPVWRQIKSALVSAAQFMSHKMADTLRSIPLEAVTEVTCTDGRLQVQTAGVRFQTVSALEPPGGASAHCCQRLVTPSKFFHRDNLHRKRDLERLRNILRLRLLWILSRPLGS